MSANKDIEGTEIPDSSLYGRTGRQLTVFSTKTRTESGHRKESRQTVFGQAYTGQKNRIKSGQDFAESRTKTRHERYTEFYNSSWQP